MTFKVRTSEEIRLLQSSGFHIKKQFGQNFLHNETTIDRIVDSANITKNTGVIEIGPGLGSMTGKLLNKAKKVLAYEIDPVLIDFLKSKFIGQSNLILLQMSILRASIDEDCQEHLAECDEIVVVANLPYYITTPILMRFLETSTRINRMVLMMQLEVAERITGQPATKDYNALSVAVAYRAETEFLFKVNRMDFVPKPNVDSGLVRLIIRERPPVKANDEPFFFLFIRQAFTQRRKTLLNNLSSAYPNINRSSIESLLSQHTLDLAVRAEALSPQQLVWLANDFFALVR
jgi:16S rRNA (adenine1518-N6/adenine1519-N6)-dimethyltransferase